MSRAACWVSGFALWATPIVAWAHSDPARFAEPPELGGSGGRYFTGSVADGHGCSVCHRGGEPPRVVFDGLPSTFEPDVRTIVTARWEDTASSHALALEIVDDEGRDAGLELIDAEDLPPQTRCEGEPDGAAAAWVVDLEPRRVLVVQDCGAREVEFAFVPSAGSELYFAASVVRSDGSATPDGDGVVDVRRTLIREGTDAGGCHIGDRDHPASLLGLLLLRLLPGIRRRVADRHKADQRNAAPNIAVSSTACTRSSPTNAR